MQHQLNVPTGLPVKVWKGVRLIGSTGSSLSPFPGSGPPEAHEEEYEQFVRLLDAIENPSPVMCELGSYWALWSLVFRKKFPEGQNILLDADLCKLAVGLKNFEINGVTCSNHWGLIGEGPNNLNLQKVMLLSGVDYLDVLHADIQGAELALCQQIEECGLFKKIGSVFIASHSAGIHEAVLLILSRNDFRITTNALPKGNGVDGVIAAVL